MTTHRFTLTLRSKALQFEGVADVYGEGTTADAEQFLRAMLAQKAGGLKIKHVKGKVITVEAMR